MSKYFIAVIVFSLFLSIEANAWLFSPSNKKDCVIEYVSKTKSEFASKIVNGACSRFFNEDKSVRKRAKCILNNKALFTAENDMAAKIVHWNSDCLEIK
jgi:hypothetical protein